MLERMLEGALIVVALRTGAELCGFGEPSPRPRRRPVVVGGVRGGADRRLRGRARRAGSRRCPRRHARCRRLVAAVHGAVRPGLGGGRRHVQRRVGDDRGRSAGVVVGEGGGGRCLAGPRLGPVRDLTGPCRDYHVSAGDVAAVPPGSSGATYFAAATLSAALVVRGTGRRRLLGLAGPAIAAALWVTANDGHSVVFVEDSPSASCCRWLQAKSVSSGVGPRKASSRRLVMPSSSGPGDRHHRRRPGTPERIGRLAVGTRRRGRSRRRTRGRPHRARRHPRSPPPARRRVADRPTSVNTRCCRDRGRACRHRRRSGGARPTPPSPA